MRKLSALVLVLAVSLVSTSAVASGAGRTAGKDPCAPDRFDLWGGHWKFSANGGPVSDLYVKLYNDGARLSGRYRGATNGNITGSLDEKCNGTVWLGTFQDTSGQNHNRGTFRVVREGREFSGYFKISGTKYRWSADKVIG